MGEVGNAKGNEKNLEGNNSRKEETLNLLVFCLCMIIFNVSMCVTGPVPVRMLMLQCTC